MPDTPDPLDAAFARITGGSPSPTPSLMAAAAPSASPTLSGTPSGDDEDALDAAFARISGPRPAGAISAAVSAAPQATPGMTQLPSPSPSPEPSPEPSPSIPPPNLSRTIAAVDNAEAELSNVGMFNRDLGRIASPANLFDPEAWIPRDVRPFPAIGPPPPPSPGIFDPLYTPERVVAGETPMANMFAPGYHKAGNLEAASANLIKNFASSATSAKGLVNFLPPVFIAETMRSVPELWNAVKEAQQTPAGSQQRWEAGMAVAATLLTGGFMGKAAFNMLNAARLAATEGMPAQPRLRTVQMKKLDVSKPPPGYKPEEPISPEESVGEPIPQGGETSAKQPSVQKVEGGETAQQQQEGAAGAVPAGQGAGDSDLSVGTPQGEGQQRPVSPQIRPRAQAPAQAEVPKEEQKQREPDAMAVEDLTDEELQQQITKAEDEFKQGRGSATDAFQLLRELQRRQEQPKPKPESTPDTRPPPPERALTPEELEIENLQKAAVDLQNVLGQYVDRPLDAEGYKVRDKLWDTFDKIHRLREESGQPRDVVIIGGGAGGLKAAMQMAYEGDDVVVLEKTATTGGQAKRSLEIVNTGAQQAGITGRKYFEPRELTARNRGADIRTGVTAADLQERPDGGVNVITSTGGVIPARRVVVLTGANPVIHPGFELAGWGNAEALASATAGGKVGMVYGAGNSATQAVAGALRRGAKKIYIVSRHEFGPEASTDQVNRLKAMARGLNAKVEFITASIDNYEKNPNGRGFIATLDNGKKYDVAHLENFLNTKFNTDWLPESIERTKPPPLKPGRKPRPGPPPPQQIHVTDNSFRTNMPGVYVGGDIRESLPGESRPRRIDMAEGDAAAIAARVTDDISTFRKTGYLPDWGPETPEERQAIDTRLKALKDPGTKGLDWETGHGDVTPNEGFPPPFLSEPVTPFHEPQPAPESIGPRPGYEGPPSKISQKKISEGVRAVAQKAAEQTTTVTTGGAQQQQQNRRLAPLPVPRSQERLRETPPMEERKIEAAADLRVKQNANYPDMVLTQLANSEKNGLNSVESTAVLNERAARQQELYAAARRAMDKTLDHGSRAEAMADYNSIDNHIRLMDEVTGDGELLTRDEAKAWHDFRAKDYSMPSMVTKLEIAQGGAPLTPAQTGTVQVLTDRLAKAMADEEAMKTRIGFRIGKPVTGVTRQKLRDIQWERHLAKTALDDKVFEARFRQRSAMYRAMMNTVKTMDMARAIMTSTDLSAVLRQGGLIAHSHPLMALKEIPDMMRAAKSDRAYFDLMQDIRERPNAHLYETSKLGLTDIKTPKWTQLEEAYGSDWADRIPIVGHSQRAYVYFLNRMRADMFDRMAQTLPRNGIPSPDQAWAISNFINTFTGRGRTPEMLATSMRALNQFFFAPRYTISRFQALFGDPLWVAKNAPGVRKLIAQEYARTLVGYGLEYTLAYYALQQLGVTIEKDPRSSDFGSIKIGNTRWNPLAGMTQPMVFAARLGATGLESLPGNPLGIKGGYKDKQGNIVSLRNPKYGKKGVSDVITEFTRSKAAPIPGMIWNGLEGKKVTGEPTTWGKELLSMVYPITLNDITGAIQTWGFPIGVSLALMALFGDSVNTYATKVNPAGVKTKKPHPTGRVRH